MEIYLIRHTKPNVPVGYCYGQSDISLEEFYLNDFKAISDKLAICPDSVVYSSSLKRCSLLADYLSGGNYSMNDALMEMNFGDWELKPYSALEKLPEFNEWTRDFVNKTVPNGESYYDFYLRVVDFFDDFVLKQDKNTYIITHSGVIRSILAKVLNIPLEYSFRTNSDYGGITKLKVTNNLLVVDYINR